MFINANGTVQKRLQQVDGKWYKVANQCHYHPSEKSHAVYELEICRQYKMRVIITYLDDTIQIGYVKHVVVNNKKFPFVFFRKNSTQGEPLRYQIKSIIRSAKRMRAGFIFQR